MPTPRLALKTRHVHPVPALVQSESSQHGVVQTRPVCPLNPAHMPPAQDALDVHEAPVWVVPLGA